MKWRQRQFYEKGNFLSPIAYRAGYAKVDLAPLFYAIYMLGQNIKYVARDRTTTIVRGQKPAFIVKYAEDLSAVCDTELKILARESRDFLQNTNSR